MILTESNFNTQTERDEEGKNLYLKGAFLLSEKVNGNGRIYPKEILEPEITKLKDQMNNGISILGELDHSTELEVRLERVSHEITDLWWEGNEVHGKAKILTETPNGQIAKGLIDNGVKVGVSSRSSGSLEENTGRVNSLNIVTPADLVSTPSFGTRPTSIYEQLQMYHNQDELEHLSDAVRHDEKAQKYFEKEIKKFIDQLFD